MPVGIRKITEYSYDNFFKDSTLTSHTEYYYTTEGELIKMIDFETLESGITDTTLISDYTYNNNRLASKITFSYRGKNSELSSKTEYYYSHNSIYPDSLLTYYYQSKRFSKAIYSYDLNWRLIKSINYWSAEQISEINKIFQIDLYKYNKYGHISERKSYDHTGSDDKLKWNWWEKHKYRYYANHIPKRQKVVYKKLGMNKERKVFFKIFFNKSGEVVRDYIPWNHNYDKFTYEYY